MIAEKSSYTYAEMREVLQKWEEVKGIRFTAVDGRQLINMIRELNKLDHPEPEQPEPEQPVDDDKVSFDDEKQKRTRRTK